MCVADQIKDCNYGIVVNYTGEIKMATLVYPIACFIQCVQGYIIKVHKICKYKHTLNVRMKLL